MNIESEDELWRERMYEARRDYDSERRVPLPRSRDRMCGALDCPNCMGEQAAREYLAELAQEDCPHTSTECGTCIECGKDVSDDLVARMEMLRDAKEDR